VQASRFFTAFHEEDVVDTYTVCYKKAEIADLWTRATQVTQIIKGRDATS